MRLYKRLAGQKHDSHAAEGEILQTTMLPSPSDLLRRSRLRYLGQLYSAGTIVPWSLLHADAQWHQLLENDLDWMWHQLASTTSLGPPSQNFPAWEEILKRSPKYWKRLVNRAALPATRQQINSYRVATFHKQFVETIHQGPRSTFKPLDMQEVKQMPQEIYACVCCSIRFGSAAAQGAHLFKKHKIPASTRKLFDQTTCASCLKEYRTFTRLKSHLRYSIDCRQRLRGLGMHCRPGPGIGSISNEALERQPDGLAPTLQAQGPHLPAPYQTPEETQEHSELRAALALALIEYTDEACLDSAFRTVVSNHAVSWQQMADTIQCLQNEHSEEEVELSGCDQATLQQICLRILDPATWPFLEQDHCRDRQLELQDYEQWLIQQVEDEDWTAFARLRGIPRFGRHRVLLHAFAGR